MTLSDDGDLNASIGRAVRKYRDEAGLTQTSLGRRMQDYAHNWHQVTVARTESGLRPLRLDEALSLAAILDVSVEDLYQHPSEVDEYDLVATDLAVREQMLTELEYSLEAAKKNVATGVDRSMEARARFESAQEEYDRSIYEYNKARDELARLREMHERSTEQVAHLRYKFERLQGGRAVQDALRDVSPSDLMDLTIKNVTGTRVSVLSEGAAVVEVLVGPDGKVAARSRPYQDQKEAMAAARAITKTFADRHRELTGAELDETQEE